MLVCAFALPLLGLAQEVQLELNVIRLRNAKASELAETLNNLAGGEPGLGITADVWANVLVIESSPEAFAAIRDVVAQLDERRPQVLIEGVLLELHSDAARTREPEPLIEAMREAAPLTGAILGRSVEVRSSQQGGPAQLPVLEAAILLQKTTRGLRIVNALSLLTADSEEGQVGVDTVDTDLGLLYGKDDELFSTIRVTPQICDEDAGALRLDATGEDVPFRGGPWIVKEGEALLLAGPIRTLGTRRTLGVPLLAALPVVGPFLRVPIGRVKEAQLLLLLTARIVRDPEDLQNPPNDPVGREKARE
jgi:hypothetical protein